MARKARYTQEQMAVALQQHEAGISVAEIVRKYGIRQQSDRSMAAWPRAM